MKERFEEAGHASLVDAVKRQEIVTGNAELADLLISRGELVEYQRGDKIIVEDGEDDDVYLLIAGSVSILVKGTQVATRKAGQVIGEMAAIEPAQKRSATDVALETVVALKVKGADFLDIGRAHCQIWLPIARELARRLKQRNDLIPAPNTSPKLFIISSAEALPVAEEIQSGLQRHVFPRLWTDGVFFAGGYSLIANVLYLFYCKFVLTHSFSITFCFNRSA
jgi:hypothetical protein